jgi:hypothetical protein
VTLAVPWVLFVSATLIFTSCQRETRAEGRQRRLDTFLSVLPESLRTDFSNIENREDCAEVGAALEEAIAESPEFAARIDSIIHAELIDSFSGEEIIYYFWYYFQHALETGFVRGP